METNEGVRCNVDFCNRLRQKGGMGWGRIYFVVGPSSLVQMRRIKKTMCTEISNCSLSRMFN